MKAPTFIKTACSRRKAQPACYNCSVGEPLARIYMQLPYLFGERQLIYLEHEFYHYTRGGKYYCR